MFKWIKNRLSKEESEDEFEEVSEEVEERFNPVGVRVNRPATTRVRPADTYVPGYNVDEEEVVAGDKQPTIVPLVHTTGVDPYNTGQFNASDKKKADPEQ